MAAAFAAVQAAPATPPPPGSSAAAHARAARLVQASPGGTLLESLVAEAESDSFAQCVQELGVLALLPLSPMRAAEEAARSLPSAAKEEAPMPSTPAQLKRIERPAAAPSNENGGGDAADDADDGGDSAWQETPDAKRVRLLKVKAARLRRAGRHADAVAALNAAQTLEMRTARAKARRSNGSGDTPSSATMERRQTISALFSE